MHFQRIWELKRDYSYDSGKGTSLLVDTGSESGSLGDGERKIIIAGFEHWFHISLLSDLINTGNKLFRFFGHQNFFRVINDLAIDFKSQRPPRYNEEIRDLFLSGFF